MLYLTSYLFLHILFLHILLVLHILFCTFLYSITHFTLLFYLYIYIYIYIYICSCVVLLLYNFYSLHCPLSGPDLIYISLLIIPCIIYHVTNKETLTFTVINAFCVNLKHISKGNQLDLSQNVVTCLYRTDIWQNTYIYIYILYVYVSNQIQQNKMQPEHVSEAERFNIPLCVCAFRSLSRSRLIIC